MPLPVRDHFEHFQIRLGILEFPKESGRETLCGVMGFTEDYLFRHVAQIMPPVK